MKRLLQEKFIVICIIILTTVSSIGQSVEESKGSYQAMIESFEAKNYTQAKKYATIVLEEKVNKDYLKKAGFICGECYYHQYEFDSALFYYKYVKNLTGKDTLNLDYLNLIFSIGISHFYKEEYNKSIQFFFDAHALSIAIHDKKREAYSLLLIGATLTKLDRFGEAFQFLSHSLEIYELIGDCDNLFRVYSEFGNLYVSQNDQKNARKYFKKALLYAEKCNNKESISVCLHNIATSQLDDDFNIDTISFYLRKSLNSIEEGPFHDLDEYTTYSMFASAFVEKNKMDSADYYLHKMKRLNEKIVDSSLLFLWEGITGRVELKKKHYKRAIDHLNKSLSIQYEKNVNYADECKLLSNVYARIGVLDSAYYFLFKAVTVSDSIDKVVQKAAILHKDVLRRIELENKELITSKKEIDLLQSQKSLSFLLMTISLVSLLILGFFVWVLYKKRKQVSNSNLFLKKILDKSEDFIVILEKSQDLQVFPKYRYKSPSSERMIKLFGQSSSGKSFLEILHPDDRAKIEEIILRLRLLKEGESYSYELRFIDVEENCYYIESTATALWKDPVIKGMIVNARDVTKQKKKEYQLKKSEKTFKDMFDNSTDHIYIIDKDGNYKDINEEGLRVSEYEKNEIINKPFSFLACPKKNELEKISSLLKEAFLGNRQQGILWGKTKSGNSYPLLTSFSLGEYFGEKVVFVHAFDISERMKAELLLKANEKKLSAYIEGTNVGIITTDQKGNIHFGNGAIVEMLSVNNIAELKALTWEDIIYHEDFDVFEDLKKNTANNRKNFTDIRIKSKSGNLLWVRVNCSKIEISLEETQNIIVFVDVDKEIKYRNELDKNLRVLSTLLNNIPNPVLLKDGNQSVILWNLAFEKMVNREGEDIKGEKVFDLISYDKIHYEMDSKAIQEGSVTYDFYSQDFYGFPAYFQIHKAAVFDDNMEISGIIVTIIDVTDIKSKTISLERLSNTQSTILSLISHDFRSIIATQKSLTDFILSSDISYEEIIELQQSMKPSIDSTFNMIDNILIWAQSQKERINFEPQNILVYPIVEENINASAMYARIKGITLEKDIPKDLMAYLDPHQFNAIVQNLLSNAIKFTKNNGKVSIRATETNSTFSVVVEDNGVGMDSNIMKSIIENKELKSVRGTENEKGSGLGMKIISDFIQLHGGEMKIDSTPNKGSSITLTFPKFKSSHLDL